MSGKQEILSIHVGQAGIQIGNALWELYCLEHGIRPDGYQLKQNIDDCESLFAITTAGKAVPRAVMVDLEPTVIDEIRHGAYRFLFPPQSLLKGKEDAASNFARGYYSVGQEMINVTLDRIRKVAEISPCLQAIFIFRSCGGGTGSGFTALLLEQLIEDYGRKIKTLFSVFPAPKNTIQNRFSPLTFLPRRKNSITSEQLKYVECDSLICCSRNRKKPRISPIIVEPYNAILTTHRCIGVEDCSFLLDNQACYEMLNILNVPQPTYTNINRLVAQVVSAVTASVCFEGPQNTDFSELQTNLLPYPRIHFPIMAYAPLVPRCGTAYQNSSMIQLTKDCFRSSNHLIKCDIRKGKFISCCMFYRGHVSITDVNRAIQQMKDDRTIRFVEWSPAGFKVAINYQPPSTVPGGDFAPTNCAACMLFNNTAIKVAWQQLLQKFKIMYKKRCFVHHYVGEGMEESEFNEAAENVAALIEDYKEVES